MNRNYKLIKVIILGLILALLIGVRPPVPSQAAPLFCDPFCGTGDKDNSNNSDDSGDGPTMSDIVGTVTDLTTGQPNNNMFVFVSINGILLRTDTIGNFSLSGLQPETFEISLVLPEGFTLAQDPQTVVLGSGTRTVVDLQYYSGSPPATDDTDTSPTDDSLAVDNNQNNQPADSQPALSSELCADIYTVQSDDWLSKIAERFLGDVLAYELIVESTAAVRVQDPTFAEITDPNVIEPGFQLCIPLN